MEKERKMKKTARLVVAPAFAAVALVAAGVRADATKFVASGWELSNRSLNDLEAWAGELDKTCVDGVFAYLNEPQPDGTTLSTHNIMSAPWRRDTLAALVPVARRLTAHRSMRESFIGTFRCASRARGRIEWTDDASWSLIASNMANAAWFAREGGFKGISMDPEDYNKHMQFYRRAGEAPYPELAKLARRRGRQVFEGVFKEFPDIKIFSFWFLSLEPKYMGSTNPARDMAECGDLWPAFADGILDAMTPKARIIDGCEHSYRYESEKGDFWRVAQAIQLKLPLLVSPENRRKYREAVGVSFGVYLDMYTNSEDKPWYFGPLNGSRLRRLDCNLSVAAEVADEYVWFWGEKFCWAGWKEAANGANPKVNQNVTWEQQLPGLNDVLLAVKRPLDFAAQRSAKLKSAGLLNPLNANSECRSANGAVPAPYEAWQEKKGRQGRLYGDSTDGDGDSFSLAAEGVEYGAFSFTPPYEVLPGERFLAMVSAKGDGISAQISWKRAGKLDWCVLSPVQLRFGPADENGWRKGRAVVRVPDTANGFKFSMIMRQKEGETCKFDNIRLVPITDHGASADVL